MKLLGGFLGKKEEMERKRERERKIQLEVKERGRELWRAFFVF